MTRWWGNEDQGDNGAMRGRLMKERWQCRKWELMLPFAMSCQPAIVLPLVALGKIVSVQGVVIGDTFFRCAGHKRAERKQTDLLQSVEMCCVCSHQLLQEHPKCTLILLYFMKAVGKCQYHWRGWYKKYGNVLILWKNSSLHLVKSLRLSGINAHLIQ